MFLTKEWVVLRTKLDQRSNLDGLKNWPQESRSGFLSSAFVDFASFCSSHQQKSGIPKISCSGLMATSDPNLHLWAPHHRTEAEQQLQRQTEVQKWKPTKFRFETLHYSRMWTSNANKYLKKSHVGWNSSAANVDPLIFSLRLRCCTQSIHDYLYQPPQSGVFKPISTMDFKEWK